MGEIIDINNLAIESAMRIYHINDQQDCLEKVRNLFHIWNKGRKKNNEA